MKAVRKKAPSEGFTLEDVPIPSVGADEVLIKIEAASICGTDLHIWSWDESIRHIVRPPVTVGHEMTGTIAEVGKNVKEFKEGDYVSPESHITCGTCSECMASRLHMCVRNRTLGMNMDGGFAEYVKVPANVLWRNNRDKLPPEIATLQEPFGNAMYATKDYDLAGKKVAVLGCGPIGLFTIGIIKAAGADRIAASDTKPYRLGLAEQMGATDLFNPVSDGDAAEWLTAIGDGEGVDIVFEMSGAQAAMDTAFKGVRKGGGVTLFGIPTGPVTLDVSAGMIFKNLTIQAVSGRRIFEDWYRSRALLESGAVNIAPLVSKQIPLDDIEEGIRLLQAGEACKIVLRPNG
ncbi:MAG: L-threonine 3-dehydrogenase [Chloroflexi bacterium]|nr:L-threonine 3-dehydrogenase [Chloroflexota bacterium]